MYFHRQRLRWQQQVKVIQKSAEVPAEYFSYAPSEAGSWGERPRSSRHRKSCSPWLQRRSLQPAYASRGTPEQYQASVQWSGGLETKSPLQRPLYEVSRPVRRRQHVYVRLCKAPFASANQRRAGADRPMRSRRFSHFVCELYKWIYINGFI